MCSGHRKYPFPQAGRNCDGTPKNKPSDSTSDSLWNGYIDYVKNHQRHDLQEEIRLPHADGLPAAEPRYDRERSRKTCGGRRTTRSTPSRTAPRCS